MSAPLQQHTSLPLPVDITLPTNVSYWDDIELRDRTISDLKVNDVWQVFIDGRHLKVNFTKVTVGHRTLFKRWFVDMLQKLSIRTAVGYFSSIVALPQGFVTEFINTLISSHPSDFSTYWNDQFLNKVKNGQVRAARSLCRMFCARGWGEWHVELKAFVSVLPSHKIDKYAKIKKGACFITLIDQSKIVHFLDDLTHFVVKNPEKLTVDSLKGAVILALAYQLALRPGQMARIQTLNIAVFESGAVHIRFPIVKQSRLSTGQEGVRSIRQEWAPLFIELLKRTKKLRCLPRYFLDSEPRIVRKLFESTLAKIGINDWSLTDMRHSAAQRLADVGSSHEMISEFMGHADEATALVYINGSPNQAERLNKALGLSEVYSTVADLIRSGSITQKDLNELPEEHIISGIPHGIPVSGLGVCHQKQSLCTKNPIISCYTCHWFLPVSDAAIHEKVVKGFRDVVTAFAKMARPGETLPAMMQLRLVLESAQSLIDQLVTGTVQ